MMSMRWKKTTFNIWISKLNELDFQKRTRSFFFELSKKYRVDGQTGLIQNQSGTLSRNLPETLKHWSDFYAELYTGVELRRNYQTLNSDPILDCEFSNVEFLDCIYDLKRNRAPGFENITNEDITSLLPDDSEEDNLDPQKKCPDYVSSSKSFQFFGLMNSSHKISREQC